MLEENENSSQNKQSKVETINKSRRRFNSVFFLLEGLLFVWNLSLHQYSLALIVVCSCIAVAAVNKSKSGKYW